MAKLTKVQQAEVDAVLKLTNTKTGMKKLLKREYGQPDVLKLNKAQWEMVRPVLEKVEYEDSRKYAGDWDYRGKPVPTRWSMSRDLLYMRSTAEMVAFLLTQKLREFKRFEAKAAAEGKKTWEYNKQPERLQFYVVQKSVSRSGMYRHLKVSVMTKDGQSTITHGVALILGWTYHDDDCIGVGGCGMDMHFHTIYSLVETLKYAGMFTMEESQRGFCPSSQHLYRISSY